MQVTNHFNEAGNRGNSFRVECGGKVSLQTDQGQSQEGGEQGPRKITKDP